MLHLSPRLIHPVPASIRLDDSNQPTAVTPLTFIAQVKWDQHSSCDHHTHIYVNHYAGSLTCLAKTIKPPLTKNQWLGAQILSIAGEDYAHAMLLIQHVLPLGHREKPTLIKAFFSATQIPIR